MWRQLFKFNKTNRAWHLPVVAGLCVAIPLLLGLLWKDMEAGKIASIGALVILYIQSNRLVKRMMILMMCGFGFIFSFAIGVLFSSHVWLSPLILGLYTFAVHYTLDRLRLSRPPGNFFFIMVASIGISMPHQPVNSANSIVNFSIGVLISCTVALYSMLVLKENTNNPDVMVLQKKPLSISLNR